MKTSKKRNDESKSKPRKQPPRKGRPEPLTRTVIVEDGALACDICGSEVAREAALFEEVEGEVVVYCGQACQANEESVEVDRGTDRDQERPLAPPG